MIWTHREVPTRPLQSWGTALDKGEIKVPNPRSRVTPLHDRKLDASRIVIHSPDFLVHCNNPYWCVAVLRVYP